MMFLNDKNSNVSTQSNFELEEAITENDMENQITTQIAVKTKKRKIIDEADKKIMQEISNFDTELKKVMNDSQCEHTFYCQS